MKSGSPSRTTAAHKTQTKIPGLVLSPSTVVTPPFISSETPPWDSRPVSGAGVVHYHLLQWPRSVPTDLGPAPLVTKLLEETNTKLNQVICNKMLPNLLLYNVVFSLRLLFFYRGTLSQNKMFTSRFLISFSVKQQY